MNKFIKNLIYGILIGASVMVPGLSGGTTAIILGVYFDIFKLDFNLLVPLSLGGIIGVLGVSKPLCYLIGNHTFLFSYFVLGIIISSVIAFKDDFKKINLLNVLLITVGGITVFVCDGISDFVSKFDIPIISYLLIGIICAAALILPGISLSNALIAFGYYDKLIYAIDELDFIFIFKILFSILIGVIVLTKALLKAYKKYPISINMMILGMILASAKQVFIRLPNKNELAICTILFIFGFAVTFLMFLFKERTGET